MGVSKPPKGPGTDPLGHPPFSKVKLEGPKKHHDYHGMDASVPGKGDKKAVPGQHWERLYNATDASDYMKSVQGDAFNPQCAKDRKTTHIKVNETDH